MCAMSYGQYAREVSLDTLVDRLDHHAWGAMPYLPDEGQDGTEAEQARDANRAAIALLIYRGYTVDRVSVGYLPNHKGSTLVVVNRRIEGPDDGSLQGDLEMLAARFGHACILSVPCGMQPRLIRRVAHGRKVDVAAAQQAETRAVDAFITVIRNRQVAFESCLPGTINGLRGMHLLAKAFLAEGNDNAPLGSAGAS